MLKENNLPLKVEKKKGCFEKKKGRANFLKIKIKLKIENRIFFFIKEYERIKCILCNFICFLLTLLFKKFNLVYKGLKQYKYNNKKFFKYKFIRLGASSPCKNT